MIEQAQLVIPGGIGTLLLIYGAVAIARQRLNLFLERFVRPTRDAYLRGAGAVVGGGSLVVSGALLLFPILILLLTRDSELVRELQTYARAFWYWIIIIGILTAMTIQVAINLGLWLGLRAQQRRSKRGRRGRGRPHKS